MPIAKDELEELIPPSEAAQLGRAMLKLLKAMESKMDDDRMAVKMLLGRETPKPVVNVANAQPAVNVTVPPIECAPACAWEFTIERDEHGNLAKIHAAPCPA